MAVPLRAVASVAMLWLLLSRARTEVPVPAWSGRTAAWLGGALLASVAGIALSALRWQHVLAALGVRAPLRALFGHCLAGQFVGNFLPSTVGGDVLRVARLSAATGESPGTFASVVIERLSGWLVLPCVSLAALAVNPALLGLGHGGRLAAAIALGTLAVLAGVLVASAHPWVGRRLGAAAGWRRFAGAVHLGLHQLRARPATAARVLGIGVAYQLATVLAVFLAASALEVTVGLTALLAFVPAVAMAQVAPVSLGGLGVREGALVVFLGPLGVPAAEAVALGLLIYGLTLAASLLGAPAFVAWRRPAAVPAGVAA